MKKCEWCETWKEIKEMYVGNMCKNCWAMEEGLNCDSDERGGKDNGDRD